MDGFIKYAVLRRTVDLFEGQTFFRARVNPYLWGDKNASPLPENELKAPPAEKATSGRLNPEGIRCLYVASEEATAVAESRPWKGAKVSVAEFKLSRGLRIVDLSQNSPIIDHTAALESWEKGAAFTWSIIAFAFSVPHHPEDSLGYLPTQYLAEALKFAGLDGVKYESAVNENGYNYAFFDAEVAIYQKAYLVEVKHVNYQYTSLVNGQDKSPPR